MQGSFHRLIHPDRLSSKDTRPLSFLIRFWVDRSPVPGIALKVFLLPRTMPCPPRQWTITCSVRFFLPRLNVEHLLIELYRRWGVQAAGEFGKGLARSGSAFPRAQGRGKRRRGRVPEGRERAREIVKVVTQRLKATMARERKGERNGV